MKRRNKITVAIILVILLLIVCAVLYIMSGNQPKDPSISTNSTSGTGNTATSGTGNTATSGTGNTATSGTTAPTAPVPTAPEHTEPQPTETKPTDPLGTEPTEPTHEHSYEATVVAPTCLEQGYTTYACACGDSYTADFTDATGHSWGEWETVTEATEESTGLEQRSCLNCETVETKENPVVVPDHTHAYTSEVTKTATCTEDGELTYTCSCGASYTESTTKTGHGYTSEVTAPTCTLRGYTTYTCTACGHSYKDNYQDALGHDYTSQVTAPTCTTDGYTTYTCKRCGHSYKDNYTDKADHNYTSVVTKPTCSERGYTTYTCKNCGYSYKDNYTDKVAHKYTSKVTKEPTCISEGVRTYTCSCGASYTEAIAKVDHSYKSTTVAPTCTKDGYTKHTCTGCGKSYTDTTVPATGHDYEFTSNTATCSRGGVLTETCKICGHKRYTATEATGCVNTYEKRKEATCAAPGYVKVICRDCGSTVSNTIIPALECTYETWNLHDAAQLGFEDISLSYVARYDGWHDYNVQVCKNCHYVDVDTIELKYSQMEAAEIMLGYVNDLRESVYGSDKKNLTLDTTLVELANIRAKELVHLFAHIGTYTNAAENIARGYINIIDQFNVWKSSEKGHYEIMIGKHSDTIYFGYGTYFDGTYFYGVQLFWTSIDKQLYQQHG